MPQALARRCARADPPTSPSAFGIPARATAVIRATSLRSAWKRSRARKTVASRRPGAMRRSRRIDPGGKPKRAACPRAVASIAAEYPRGGTQTKKAKGM